MTDNLIVFENKGIGSWCKFSQNLLDFHMSPWKCYKKDLVVFLIVKKKCTCVFPILLAIFLTWRENLSRIKFHKFLPKEAILLNQENIQVQDDSSEEVSVHSVRHL